MTLASNSINSAAQGVLSQFAATGVQTSFHGRHISPQIMAGLDGTNWGLTAYESRGGIFDSSYLALRRTMNYFVKHEILAIAERHNAAG